MKNLEIIPGLQEMNAQEVNDINGGWSWRGAALGAITCWELGPVGAVIGAVAGGFLVDYFFKE